MGGTYVYMVGSFVMELIEVDVCVVMLYKSEPLRQNLCGDA